MFEERAIYSNTVSRRMAFLQENILCYVCGGGNNGHFVKTHNYVTNGGLFMICF